MKFKAQYLGALAVLNVVAFSPAQADARRDYYFQQGLARHYNLSQNARSFGMAGSSVATSSDSSSVIGNPAGLGFMEEAETSFTYSTNTTTGNDHPTYQDVEYDEDLGQALFAVPLGPEIGALPRLGNFGLGWTGYDGDDAGDTISSSAKGHRLTAAYAIALSNTTSIGYSVNYFNDELNSDIYNYNMNDGFRHTFGLQNRSDSMTTGLALFFGHGDHDVDYAGSTTKDQNRQYGAELGAGWQLTDKTLLASSVDYSYYDTESDFVGVDPFLTVGSDIEAHAANARVGVEHHFNEWFAARAGYRYALMEDIEYSRPELSELNGSAKYNAWTLGAGFNLPIDHDYLRMVKVDYGVEYRAVGDDDWQHVVTLSVPFGVCRPIT